MTDLIRSQEILEKALGGLRHKLQGSRSNLAEAERYRKQQLLLERELSRVRVLLAHNSKVDNFESVPETATNTRFCLFSQLQITRQSKFYNAVNRCFSFFMLCAIL